MDRNALDRFAAWEQALGTVVAALAATPTLNLNETTKKNLSLIGNVLQGTANGLEADIDQDKPLISYGEKIQAAGNSTVVASILLPLDEKTKSNLNIAGNLFQATGSAMAIPYYLYIDQKKLSDVLNLYGNFLQTIGNSLQALSANLKPEEKSTLTNFAGSWIQAFGAILQAIAAMITGEDDDNVTVKTDNKG